VDIFVPDAGVRVEHGRLLVPGRYRAAGIIKPGRMKRQFHFFCGQGSLVFPDGTIELQDSEPVPNAVADEGEANLINVYLKEQAHAAGKWLFLINDSGLVETDTMASITSEAETPGADGYNRPQLSTGGWGANALDSGDFQTVAAEETFGPNTAVAWTLTHVGVTTHATDTSGLFLAYLATATGSVATGVAYKYTLTWKFS